MKKKVSKKDDRDTVTKIGEELKPILQKYGCKNVVFAADITPVHPDDKEFVGLMAVENYGDPISPKEFILSFANAGRMYQATREIVFRMRI